MICPNTILRIAISLLLLGATASGFAARVVADPADGYSMPAVFKPRDFLSLSRLFIQGGDSIWMADNYKVSELKPALLDGQEWVRWHFVKKTGITPSLAYYYPSRIGSLKYSLIVGNGGKDPVTLSGSGDANVRNWRTIEAGETRLVEFAGAATLVAQRTKADQECDLLLRDLTIYYPEAAGLSVTGIEASRQFVAGKKMGVKVAIQGSVAGHIVDLRDPAGSVGDLAHPTLAGRIESTGREERMRPRSPCALVFITRRGDNRPGL